MSTQERVENWPVEVAGVTSLYDGQRQGVTPDPPAITWTMTVDEAAAAKWTAGRLKYGAEFVGDPLEELYLECLDGLNYCGELRRRGRYCGARGGWARRFRRLAEEVRAAAALYQGRATPCR